MVFEATNGGSIPSAPANFTEARMREGAISIPETRWETVKDRVLHVFHRLRLPRVKMPDDHLEPSLKDLLCTLLPKD